MLHHRDFQLVPLAHGRYLADHVPGARVVVLQDLGGRRLKGVEDDWQLFGVVAS